MSFKQHETSDVNNVDPFEVKAVQSYKARKKGELSFKTDQIIVVTKSNVKEMMYFGTLDGKEGWFPYFYVKSVFSKPERAQKQEEHHNPIQHVANKFTGSKRKERVKKDAVLKSGMLGKQMDSNSGMYKQRWCVLRPQKLSYYRSASDPKSLGKVSVKTFKSVDYDATASKESKLFCFTIVTKKKENLTFACKRNEECDDWIKKIKQVISDTGHGSIRRPNTGSGLKFKFDSWSAPRKPSPKKSIADVIPQENNNNKVSPPSSPPVAPLPRTSRLQRQLTLKKLQQKLVTSTETENFLKRIERIKPSYDVNSAPSCDDIELESIVIPPEQYVGRVRANYNYIGKSEFELTFRKNDEILLLSKAEKKGWMFGLFDHREGYFPKSYVSVLEMTEAETPKPLRRKNTISSEETTKKKEKLVSLLENFQIGERIGKGQYGSVYRGINVDNGEMVAIKQVEIVKMKKKEIQLIMGELELLKEMNHTNILGYKTFIRTNEHINIVLDLVEGGSLASILGKFGVIPEKLAICYIKQILDGLEYLHTRDVIHRDIKCGNILVTKDGSVKLADFGIAMKLGDPSAPAVGSPYWMAPEVIEMRGSSSACDIWALGCTIIELLTGQPPYFEFNQVQAMFCMVENERPPFPQNISPEMESFLDKCFQRDPSKRPTAKQLKKHRLVRSPDEDSEDELDITSIEGLGDLDLAALQDLQNFGDTFGNLDGFNQKDFSGANFQALLDNLSTQLENEAEADENSSGGDVDAANFVKEEDLRFLQEDEKAQKLISAFHDAMDKKKVDLAIRTRKSVRNYLKELKEIEATDSRFEILVQQAAMAMDRCEDEMGQYIPVDSDEDSL